MTYGETSAAVQHALAELLVQYRRVNRHLGGAVGRHPATRTVAERAELSALAQRYRWPVLLWARDAAAIAATRTVHGSSIGHAGVRVARALAAWTPPARDLPGGRGPSTHELSTRNDAPVVDAWRRAAVAAVHARERDLPALRTGTPLSPDERRDIARDVMAAADALMILDTRWAAADAAWRRLAPAGAKQVLTRSGREVHALLDLTGPPLWDVDGRGAPTGTAHRATGSVEAWSRVAAAIEDSESSATTLRRTIRKTVIARIHAVGLANGAGRADLARSWTRAAEALAQLSRDLRNVASLGAGDDVTVLEAVGAAEASLERPAGLPGVDLDMLAVAFDHVDHAIGVRLEEAIGVGTYLGTWTSRIEHRAVGGVRHARPFFEPITLENHPDLLAAVARLARTLPPPLPRPVPRSGRTALADALQERHDPATGGTPNPGELGWGVAALVAKQRAAQVTTTHLGPEGPR